MSDIVSYSKIVSYTGCSKKIETLCLLIISATKYQLFKYFFFLLKTEIYLQILNTKPFVCNFLGLRYMQNKSYVAAGLGEGYRVLALADKQQAARPAVSEYHQENKTSA